MHSDVVTLRDFGWIKLWRRNALACISPSYSHGTSDSKSKAINKTARLARKSGWKVMIGMLYFDGYKIITKTKYYYFFILIDRLLSMTPICCLEASSNSSQAANTSLSTPIQMSSSNATYTKPRSSVSNSANQMPLDPQVTHKASIIQNKI